ncbi:MAG: vitamin K epoxide reductase family protein [Candidatus Kerfeldbacteria bacterium]|nr:vitamin K epoxide reductase family protein [Candidatus Kerfeldbacteria bacterium]
MLVVSLIGFIDATYLTIEHYRGVIPGCAFLSGCGEVTTSSFAVIAGIPLAVLGMVCYVTIFFGVIAYLDSRNTRLWHILSLVSTIGFFGTLYFVYLQVFVIRAICIYCMVSAVTSTTLFVLSMIVLHRLQDKKLFQDPNSTNNPESPHLPSV